MPIIVETGEGLLDSNSYISVKEMEDYAALRGFSFDEDQNIETMIIRAADYFEGLSFVGVRKTLEQAMQWPRKKVRIYNFRIEDDQIPKQLKKAQCECVLSIAQGLDPNSNNETSVSSESIAGAISVSYATDSGDSDPVATPALDAALAPLLDPLALGLFTGVVRV